MVWSCPLRCHIILQLEVLKCSSEFLLLAIIYPSDFFRQKYFQIHNIVPAFCCMYGSPCSRSDAGFDLTTHKLPSEDNTTRPLTPTLRKRRFCIKLLCKDLKLNSHEVAFHRWYKVMKISSLKLKNIRRNVK
jgi:hypothetical protein